MLFDFKDKKANFNQKGFTLIELLVVIAIIGLLSAVVLAALNSARKKAESAKIASDMIQVQKAIELYRSDNNGDVPPVGENSLGEGYSWSLFGSPTLENSLSVLISEGYISSINYGPNYPNNVHNFFIYATKPYLSTINGYSNVKCGDQSPEDYVLVFVDGSTGNLKVSDNEYNLNFPEYLYYDSAEYEGSYCVSG
jgi:prepilin-type N-terminal cleavage/methylation domain-containing protein